MYFEYIVQTMSALGMFSDTRLIYYHMEVYVILYWFEYVHILYLRYFKISYIKKMQRGLIVCTIY
jgi:hypothetical protein